MPAAAHQCRPVARHHRVTAILGWEARCRTCGWSGPAHEVRGFGGAASADALAEAKLDARVHREFPDGAQWRTVQEWLSA